MTVDQVVFLVGGTGSRLGTLTAETPQPVPTDFITELQQRAIEEPVVEEIVRQFERDAIVRILAGAFRDRVGRVLSSSQSTTRVAVEAFGREVVTTISTSELDRQQS